MSYKIIVIEDSPTMRQLIGFALRGIEGLKLVEAVDGLDGLKKLQAETFDLAIVDINMPVMDGLKLIGLMRQDPRLKDIPVLIISTEGQADAKEKARAMGVEAYITKPVIAAHVAETVKKLLAKKEEQKSS